MNRGDWREPIFRDEVDRKRFIVTLGEVCTKRIGRFTRIASCSIIFGVAPRNFTTSCLFPGQMSLMDYKVANGLSISLGDPLLSALIVDNSIESGTQ